MVDIRYSQDHNNIFGLWQTIGPLRFKFNRAMQRKRDFSSLLIKVYTDKNDYAL